MLAKRQLTLQGMGVMNVANDVLPNLKAVMTAIILGIIPFLTLFLVTSLYKEALKFIVVCILWLTTWGVMIAVSPLTNSRSADVRASLAILALSNDPLKSTI